MALAMALAMAMAMAMAMALAMVMALAMALAMVMAMALALAMVMAMAMAMALALAMADSEGQEMKVVTLRHYINVNYDGNLAAFARKINRTPKTVGEWVRAGCIWVEGEEVKDGVYSLRMENKDDAN